MNVAARTILPFRRGRFPRSISQNVPPDLGLRTRIWHAICAARECGPLSRGPVGDYWRWPMLEWIKKDDVHSEHPMHDLASATALLANLRGSDPVAALADLTGWAES